MNLKTILQMGRKQQDAGKTSDGTDIPSSKSHITSSSSVDDDKDPIITVRMSDAERQLSEFTARILEKGRALGREEIQRQIIADKLGHGSKSTTSNVPPPKPNPPQDPSKPKQVPDPASTESPEPPKPPLLDQIDDIVGDWDRRRSRPEAYTQDDYLRAAEDLAGNMVTYFGLFALSHHAQGSETWAARWSRILLAHATRRLQQDKLTLRQQKIKQDYELAMKEFEFKCKVHDDKMRLEREKLQVAQQKANQTRTAQSQSNINDRNTGASAEKSVTTSTDAVSAPTLAVSDTNRLNLFANQTPNSSFPVTKNCDQSNPSNPSDKPE